METEALAEEMMACLFRLIKSPIQKFSETAKGEMGVLGYLNYISDGTPSPTELSRAFGVSTARITIILNGLEKKGYISRASVPEDRRKVQVMLTRAGRETARQCRKEVTAAVDQLLDALGEEAATYVHLTERVVEICASGRLTPPCSAFQENSKEEDII